MEILSTNQIAVRIRDKGGGVKAKDMPLVWQYLYSGAGDVTDGDEDGMKGGTLRAPMAGYGSGLPLSRLAQVGLIGAQYARYFGDLRLESRGDMALMLRSY
ncbi:hypothetical protein FRC10_008470 [Ceratobasidium sp. 414]|nr:hypothetical protein FRC10_008470 [Ceratobasidium sp. 414]